VPADSALRPSSVDIELFFASGNRWVTTQWLDRGSHQNPLSTRAAHPVKTAHEQISR
jgi:hypothetical protein